MESAEALQRRIRTVEDLQGVVKTMKALAAAGLRQYERAVQALGEYNRTVEMGLQIALRNRPEEPILARVAPRRRIAAIVLGTDQGMCGPLNDQVAAFALEQVDQLGPQVTDSLFLAVGQRMVAQLQSAERHVEEGYSVPGSTVGVDTVGQDILFKIEEWQADRQVEQILLFHAKPTSPTSFQPSRTDLLPLDRGWLEELRAKPWPTKQLPMFTMNWGPLFKSLIRQYLFVNLYRALVESLASENASRLASMQAADRNIDERLDELRADFHRQRQTAITSELLDIIGGFEALSTHARQPSGHERTRALIPKRD